MRRRGFLKALLAVPFAGLALTKKTEAIVPKLVVNSKHPRRVAYIRNPIPTWWLEGSSDPYFTKPYVYETKLTGRNRIRLKETIHFRYIRVVVTPVFGDEAKDWKRDTDGTPYLWFHIEYENEEIHIRSIDCLDFCLLPRVDSVYKL